MQNPIWPAAETWAAANGGILIEAQIAFSLLALVVSLVAITRELSSARRAKEANAQDYSQRVLSLIEQLIEKTKTALGEMGVAPTAQVSPPSRIGMAPEGGPSRRWKLCRGRLRLMLNSQSR